MSIFSGQFGSFGGGYITGPKGVQTSEGRSDLIGSGGGYMYGGGAPMGAMARPAMIQEVQIGAGAVMYAETTGPSKPRQPGRQMPRYKRADEGYPFMFPVSPGTSEEAFEGIHRQKRY